MRYGKGKAEVDLSQAVQQAQDGARRPKLLLVAPNVSYRMGGEAIKAAHILEGYHAMGIDVIQVVHARVRDELVERYPHLNFAYVEDGPVQVWFFRRRLYWFLDLVGGWLLNRAARKVAAQWKPDLVHFTSPISPSHAYFPVPEAPVVIGPLNGNLPHPPMLRYRESRGKKIGEKLLRPVQLLHRLFFRGKFGARLLISGGARTVHALELGGCKRSQMIHTLDSGVGSEFKARPRLTHEGENWRFVFLGRLVRYKGCDIAIRALKLLPNASLDIVGDGVERAFLEGLARELGVADRVNFSGYTTNRDALFEQLRCYRAFVFPTLAEANGIVIQEAMMIGLPVISINWGGPKELLNQGAGILIEPAEEDAMVTAFADAMSRLATDPAQADHLAQTARDRAERDGFDWPSLLTHWLGLYDDFLREKGADAPFLAWLKTRTDKG